MIDTEEMHRRIVKFLAREFAREGERSCTRVDLLIGEHNQRGTILRTWARTEEPQIFESLARIEMLTSEILEAASQEATVAGPSQAGHRFQVKTTQHLGGTQFHSFRVSSEDEETGMVHASSPLAPSGGGDQTAIITQLMRHNENIMKINTQSMAGVMTILHRQTSAAMESNERLLHERREQFTEVEEARSSKDERELAGIIQLKKEERKSAAFDKVLSLLPIVAGRMIAKEGASEGDGEAAVSMMISELADTITPDQIQALQKVLSVEQVMLVFEAMKAAKSTRQTAEPDAAKAVASS